MSDYENNEFDDIRVELNNWHIEQQRKLREFQEAQRKLLDSEHEKVLCNLKTQNYDQRHSIDERDHPVLEMELKYDWETCDSKMKNPNCIFNFKSDAIKLKDPKFNICSKSDLSQSDDKSNDISDCHNEDEESSVGKPRKFLRRGDGLARFRMTLDDFKSPPDIYKDKKIKTYLSQKPELNKKKFQSKTVKSVNEMPKKKKSFNTFSKPRAVPVNIYVNDNKNKNCKSGKTNCDLKDNVLQCQRRIEAPIPKVQVKSLMLKPIMLSHSNKDPFESDNGANGKALKSQIIIEGIGESSEQRNLEKQIRKDERELRMFEMLEGKIDDGTLSPNSSIVARFMDDSLCSTPSKPINGDFQSNIACSYIESLRAMQRKYLTAEQINRIQECKCDEFSSDDNYDFDNANDDQCKKLSAAEMEEVVDKCENGCTSEKEKFLPSKGSDLPTESSKESLTVGNESSKVSDEALEDCVENYSTVEDEIKDRCELRGGDDRKELAAEEDPPEQPNQPLYNHREIAIKLQRKALQDNVKTLLNWDVSSRKKEKKRVLKKAQMKSSARDKSKIDATEEEEKLIFNGGALKGRLEELEKEIEIFKRENRNLIQLQKDCDADKKRLEKERRDFEKHMQQEREIFEEKMQEEQKKLQRSKSVFDKYCKHIKSQPNKKEREEITNLRKEIERLTELLATKDSRWGSAQARLRNQIKTLEKENSELKLEMEKLKKQTIKKVSFESEKNMGTKIIHAINSELGKLKPHLIRSGSAKQKFQSLSARVDPNLADKPMRRIKSVPDLKKTSQKINFTSPVDPEDNAASADGVGTMDKCDSHRSRLTSHATKKSDFHRVNHNSQLTSVQANDVMLSNSASIGIGDVSPPRTEEEEAKDKCSIMKGYATAVNEESKETRGSTRADVEMILEEALFENRDRGDYSTANGTISEIKKRLENLNSLHSSQQYKLEYENGEEETLRNSERRIHSSSDESFDSADDDEDEAVSEEAKDNGNEGPHEVTDNGRPGKLRDNSFYVNYVFQSKVDDKGLREKTFDDGRKEIFYPNGNIKKISADSRVVKMIYYNGDLKETDIAQGSEKYFYAETKTWHTTYKDGLEVLEFPNGQRETRHPDGSTEILFPNGCVRYCDSSGKDEWRFVDGTVIKTDKNGQKVLLLPNGQKEIHTKDYKKREYPDGTIKLLYADGTQETRYSSGRVRLKDKDGNLVMDSGGIP